MLTRPRSWLPQQIVNLYDNARLDIASVWGLLLQRRFTEDGFDYLQVGCGDDLLPGFLNTDHFINRNAPAHVDIRYPLPFKNERWRGIYAHHILEHITQPDAMRFFREAHRTLKPGGILRIVVPDAEKALRLYGSPAQLYDILPPGHRDEIEPRTAMMMINFVFYCNKYNAHLSAWDFETMALCLQRVGFASVTRAEFGISADPHLSNIDPRPHWAAHSLYVDAVK